MAIVNLNLNKKALEDGNRTQVNCGTHGTAVPCSFVYTENFILVLEELGFTNSTTGDASMCGQSLTVRNQPKTDINLSLGCL